MSNLTGSKGKQDHLVPVSMTIYGPSMIYAPILAGGKVIRRSDRDLWLIQVGWMSVSREGQMFRESDGQAKKSCKPHSPSCPWSRIATGIADNQGEKKGSPQEPNSYTHYSSEHDVNTHRLARHSTINWHPRARYLHRERYSSEWSHPNPQYSPRQPASSNLCIIHPKR